MRTLVRLTVLGLAAYGAKALYDRYGSSVQRTGQVQRAAETATGSAREVATTPGSSTRGRVDPNSPVAQADDAVAVAMSTPMPS